MSWVDLPQGFPAVWIFNKDPNGLEKKMLVHKELKVNNRTAYGIFNLIKETL